MLRDGAILSLLGGFLIYGSLRANPRIWLNDFPKDIRAAVPPKTDDDYGHHFRGFLIGIVVAAVVGVVSAAAASLWSTTATM